jgi:CubicO group peptidase (beta-lactamase class C family)
VARPAVNSTVANQSENEMKQSVLNRRSLLQTVVAGAGAMIAAGVQSATAQNPATNFGDSSIDYRGEASGLMEGFPPDSEKRVDINNYTSSIARTRWALQNPDIVFRTVEVGRGAQPTSQFPRANLPKEDVNAIRVPWKNSPDDTAMISFSEWLLRSSTEAFVAVHDGRIVVEIYFGDARPQTRHVFFSAGKSFLAAVAATFIGEGELTEDAQVERFVPELRKTGLAGATIRHLLDQQSGVKFKEFPLVSDDDATVEELTFGTDSYRNSPLQMPTYSRVAGILPFLASEHKNVGLYDFLFQQTEKVRKHGTALWYAEPHVLALQLIIERLAQRSFIELLSERIWSKLAPEHSGRAIVDCVGTASNGTGLCFTARDAARFGQMLLDGGAVEGRQVIPEAFMHDICLNPNSSAVNPQSNMWGGTAPNAGYRSLFWTSPTGTDGKPFVGAVGLYSQHVLVDPLRRTVIVKLSTLPSLADLTTDFVALCNFSRSLSKLTI